MCNNNFTSLQIILFINSLISLAISLEARLSNATNKLLAETLSVIGDDWTFLILRQAFWGVTRFDSFLGNLGLARTQLANRLKYLTNIGLFEKRPYQDRPRRYEYVLSERGLDLHEIAILIHQWADRWRGEGTNRPQAKYHTLCGAPLQLVYRCNVCKTPLTLDTLQENTAPQCCIMESISSMLTRWQRRKNAVASCSDFDPVAHALRAFGDRWSLQIIDSVLSGVRRFDELQASLSVARNILTDRLVHLEEEALLARVPYQTTPLRYDYAPTESAVALFGVLTAIRCWGQRWLFDETRSAPEMVHTTCGSVCTPELICKSCEQPLEWGDVDYSDPAHSEAKDKLLSLVGSKNWTPVV